MFRESSNCFNRSTAANSSQEQHGRYSTTRVARNQPKSTQNPILLTLPAVEAHAIEAHAIEAHAVEAHTELTTTSTNTITLVLFQKNKINKTSILLTLPAKCRTPNILLASQYCLSPRPSATRVVRGFISSAPTSVDIFRPRALFLPGQTVKTNADVHRGDEASLPHFSSSPKNNSWSCRFFGVSVGEAKLRTPTRTRTLMKITPS